MKVFYLCHPVAGDVPGNLFGAREWLRWLYQEMPGIVVVAPWIHDIESLPLRDHEPAERERALDRCCETVRRMDGVILVGGRISEGMKRELQAARLAEIEVIDLTHLGPVPPPPWRCTVPRRAA